ncbi:MAG: hypothetical protein LBQ57_08465 [Spirochaetales bacterium]|jgi:hypothetical protein|nr:hypothetical protein [Spirochaetales bacterium]
MSEVLSQDEIEQLLSAISFDFRDERFESMENFESFLVKRQTRPEKYYGRYQDGVPVCRFFTSKKGESILADIERKNAEQGMGNVEIPNTKIKLINYSFCPTCNKIFSFTELVNYYANPKPDPRFNNRTHQFRQDTRMYCSDCGTYFLPALVISDGTPKNEMQFLCRVQTADAIERFFMEKGMKVLTGKNENLMRRNGLRAIRNDIILRRLEPRQTLISNLLQYTPRI